MFFWRPVKAGLLTFSEIENIGFVDLVHAHEVCDMKDAEKAELLGMAGQIFGANR
jgi:hypothetical protein